MKKILFVLFVMGYIFFNSILYAQDSKLQKVNCGDCIFNEKCQPTLIKNKLENFEYGAYITLISTGSNCPAKVWLTYEVECENKENVWWSEYCYRYETNKEFTVIIGAMNSIYTGKIRVTKIDCQLE